MNISTNVRSYVEPHSRNNKVDSQKYIRKCSDNAQLQLQLYILMKMYVTFAPITSARLSLDIDENFLELVLPSAAVIEYVFLLAYELFLIGEGGRLPENEAEVSLTRHFSYMTLTRRLSLGVSGFTVFALPSGRPSKSTCVYKLEIILADTKVDILR